MKIRIYFAHHDDEPLLMENFYEAITDDDNRIRSIYSDYEMFAIAATEVYRDQFYYLAQPRLEKCLDLLTEYEDYMPAIMAVVDRGYDMLKVIESLDCGFWTDPSPAEFAKRYIENHNARCENYHIDALPDSFTDFIDMDALGRELIENSSEYGFKDDLIFEMDGTVYWFPIDELK